MKHIVEFCGSNGAQQTYAHCEKHPHIDAIEYGCLGQCETCDLHPFALVNGQLVEAPDEQTLQTRIIEAINTPPQDPYAWIDDVR